MPEVVFIGTGDAFGSGGRRYSAILLRNQSDTLLLDCGPTTPLGLKSLGIDPREIDAIAISHFHGDHFAGLPFLLLDYHFETRRKRPLQIFGPPGIEGRVERMSSALEYGPIAERPFEIHFSEFSCGRDLMLEDFTLRPFPAYHTPETCPHMLRIQIGAKSLFFTGDTGWCEELPHNAADADLFICECVYMEDQFEFHLSHDRLYRERRRFSARRMLLTHLGSEVLDHLECVHFETAHDGLHLEL